MDANEQDMKQVVLSEDDVRNARMTPEQSARFAGIRDEDIVYDEDSPDTSDWPDEMFSRSSSSAAAVHLDPDVVSHFRKLGPDYEKRMSAALRDYMAAHERTG